MIGLWQRQCLAIFAKATGGNADSGHPDERPEDDVLPELAALLRADSPFRVFEPYRGFVIVMFGNELAAIARIHALGAPTIEFAGRFA